MKIADRNNCWAPTKTVSSGAARGLERLRRIDIEKRAIALDRNFRHRFVMLGNEMSGADVAIERLQFIEETARPQHGIAAAAVADRDRDQIAAIWCEAIDQAVDKSGRNHRHVAETDHGAIGLFRHGRYASLYRAREPVREIRFADEFDIEPGERLLDQIGLMAGDHDDILGH